MSRSFRFVILLLCFLMFAVLAGHTVGVSFSYFLPRNGWFSHPVPPLSLRRRSIRSRIAPRIAT